MKQTGPVQKVQKLKKRGSKKEKHRRKIITEQVNTGSQVERAH